MFRSCLLGIFVTLLVTPSTLRADEDRLWTFVAGSWEFVTSSGIKADMEWKPLADGSAVLGTWTGADGVKSTSLAGWRADKEAVVVDGYGNQANFWHIEFTEFSDNTRSGSGHIRYADGTEVKGTMLMQKVSRDQLESRIEGRDAAGDNVVVTMTWKRK